MTQDTPKRRGRPAKIRALAHQALVATVEAKEAQEPKQSAPKNVGGRPTIYTPEIAQQVFEIMSKGYSLDGAAGMIGMSHDNMYRWQREHPEFAEAVRNGRVAGTAWWERRVLEIADGAPGNITAALFGLKNRSRAASGWHDISKTEVTGADGGAIQTEVKATIDAKALDPDARAALRAALKAAKASE